MMTRKDFVAFADIFGRALANAPDADRAAISGVASEAAYVMGASNYRFDRTRFKARVLAAERLAKNQGER